MSYWDRHVSVRWLRKYKPAAIIFVVFVAATITATALFVRVLWRRF